MGVVKSSCFRLNIYLSDVGWPPFDYAVTERSRSAGQVWAA